MPQITCMLAGDEYYIALCEDKTVWSWGDNADGKLGVAVEALLQPERISGLDNIVKIVDGGKDIFALTADGEVFYWGWGLGEIQYDRKRANHIVYTPTRLKGLEKIVDLDGRNRRFFALDQEGRMFSLGLYLGDVYGNKVEEVFFGCEELGRDIDRIMAGAGNYHYFIRRDGTVCSIMQSLDDIFRPCKFLFPIEGKRSPVAESYAVPEELECLRILNEYTKPDHVVYYDLAGVSDVEAASADSYTVFLSRTDGTLWYWDSDRIKYHDDERALLNPDNARESCAGRWVPIHIGEVLHTDGQTGTFRVIDMASGTENTLFLTDDGSVFVSRYETCGVEDVHYYVKANPNPGKLPSVEMIEGMELKTLVFERLPITNITDISTDGQENFTAVDARGVCYRYKTAGGETEGTFISEILPGSSGGRRDDTGRDWD